VFRSRSFGIVTTDSKVVKEAMKRACHTGREA